MFDQDPRQDFFAGASCLGVYQSVQDAWRGALRYLSKAPWVDGVRDPWSVGSRFGSATRDTRELIATSFTITRPRRRLINSHARPIDLGYAIANVIWTMTGSADLEMIATYNPNAAKFSDDGRTLYGAPGARLLSSLAGDQFGIAAELLRRDPSTRRALVQIYSSNDLGVDTRDCPCLTSLQFLVRRGRLDCIGNMRSQSALMLLPYDLFLLTMIHEVLATRLGLPLGSYHHFCGSLHYYREEKILVDKVLDEKGTAPSEMPSMPPEAPDLWNSILAAEQAARASFRRVDEHATIRDDVRHYWRELIRVMIAAARCRRGEFSTEDELLTLPELYRPIIILRKQSLSTA